MKKLALVALVVVAAVVIVRAVVRDAKPEYRPRPASITPMVELAVHRKPIKNGFLLMLDQPLVEEYEGNRTVVLGIGRARVRQRNGAVREKMLILLKLTAKNALIGDARYGPVGESEAKGVDPRSIGLPFKTSFTNGSTVRVQAVAADLPNRNARCFNSEECENDTEQLCMAFEVRTLRLDARPIFGPAPLSKLDQPLKPKKNMSMEFVDAVTDNPWTVLEPEADYPPIASQLDPRSRYLSLRFHWIHGNEVTQCDLCGIAYGDKGEKILLKSMPRGYGMAPRTHLIAYLGMQLPTWDMNNLEITREQATRVQAVDPAGPAAKAGVKVGDSLFKFGDTSVENGSSLYSEMPFIEVGKPVDITVVRKRKSLHLTLVPCEDPLYSGMHGSSAAAAEKGARHVRGLKDWRVGSALPEEARAGTLRVTSVEPIPPGFHLAKVALYNDSDDPAGQLRIADFGLPEIPIPQEFWK